MFATKARLQRPHVINRLSPIGQEDGVEHSALGTLLAMFHSNEEIVGSAKDAVGSYAQNLETIVATAS